MLQNIFFVKFATEFYRENESGIETAEEVQEKLNNRPRKILKYKTPAYRMDLETHKIKYQNFKLN